MQHTKLKNIRNVICKRLKNVQFLIYEGQRQTTTDKNPTAKGYLSDLSDLKSELHKLVDICVYKYLLNIYIIYNLVEEQTDVLR